MAATTSADQTHAVPDVVLAANSERLPRWPAGAGLPALAAAAFIAVVTIYRLGAVHSARYPGHADPAFYYGVAQNLHAGQGPQINYIWEFLSGRPDLPRYAFDYWLPLPSVLMSVALRFGDSLAAALTVNVIASVLLAAATYALARRMTPAVWVPAAAAAIVVVQPWVSVYSVMADGPLYLALFTVLAVLAAVEARSRPWLWPLAGILAALANLSRSEGLLLVIGLVVAAVAWAPRGRKVLFPGALLGGYLVAMSPLYVVSYRHIGTLMPPASSKFPFVTAFENLYSIRVTTSASAFFGNSVSDFLMLRLTTIGDEFTGILDSMFSVDIALVLVLLGAGLSRVPSWSFRRAVASPWFAPAVTTVIAMLFFACIVPILAGETQKWMTALMPMLVIAALMQLHNLSLRPPVVVTIVAVLVAAPFITLASLTRTVINTNNGVGDAAALLEPVLNVEQACIGKPVVLMTRRPWEVTQATGYRTVMIPNGPLADTLAIAHRYGVTDIELDKSRPPRCRLDCAHRAARSRHRRCRAASGSTASRPTSAAALAVDLGSSARSLRGSASSRHMGGSGKCPRRLRCIETSSPTRPRRRLTPALGIPRRRGRRLSRSYAPCSSAS